MNYNFESMTTEELMKLVQEFEDQKNEFNQMQYALKIAMNSIYGAFCNVGFNYFNIEVAESITTQGRSLIQFGMESIDRYFSEMWHKDIELHKHLGINSPEQLKPVVFYGDTDSTFLSFQELIIENFPEVKDPKEKVEIILKIYKFRLEKYIKDCFDSYAERTNTSNSQDFELEAIFENGIILGRKKYVLNTTWKMPGIHIESLSKLKITGVEMVRGNTPIIIAEHLTKFVKYIISQGRNLKLNELTRKFRDFKHEYMLADISQIVYNTNVNDYDKYVINDRQKLTLASGCPIAIRAAANYNHIYFKNLKKYGERYKPIQKKDKMSFYYVKDYIDDKKNIFGYIDGEFPQEFAPSIDKELMFNKTFLDPLNRFVSIMLNKNVPENLIFQVKLFKRD